VADVGVPVTLSQGISPSFRGWTVISMAYPHDRHTR
jgi:hypothetical protein